MEAWDTGLDNLWSISLAPWIAAHAHGGLADAAGWRRAGFAAIVGRSQCGAFR